jgi:hypothetical protein
MQPSQSKVTVSNRDQSREAYRIYSKALRPYLHTSQLGRMAQHLRGLLIVSTSKRPSSLGPEGRRRSNLHSARAGSMADAIPVTCGLPKFCCGQHH